MVRIDIHRTFEKVAYDDESLRRRGAARAASLPSIFDVELTAFEGARFLEIGCGRGETSAALQADFGAEVVAVDIGSAFERGPYAKEDFFVECDAASVAMRGLGRFDYIFSYDCLEHVERPAEAVANLRHLLKRSGRAYLKFNLYRGPSASHLTAHVNLPWMHLILSEEEIRERMKAATGRGQGPVWVNKLTHLHYLELFEANNLIVEKCWYREVDIDPVFYEQYEDKLKAYPKTDLRRDFMQVVLRRRRKKEEPAAGGRT